MFKHHVDEDLATKEFTSVYKSGIFAEIKTTGNFLVPSAFVCVLTKRLL